MTQKFPTQGALSQDSASVDTNMILDHLDDTIYDALLGDTAAIDALFINASPTTEELARLQTVKKLLAQNDNYALYDIDTISQELHRCMLGRADEVITELTLEDTQTDGHVARDPIEMIYELIGMSEDSTILYIPDDWVWGPCGPPYRGGDAERHRNDEEHLHVVHANYYKANLDLYYEQVEEAITVKAADAYTRATNLVDQEHEAKLIARQAVSQFRKIEERLTGEAELVEARDGLSAQGWIACKALHTSAAQTLEIAQAVTEARSLDENEIYEAMGWQCAQSLSRLQALQDIWFYRVPVQGSPEDFISWYSLVPGGTVAYWRGVNFAASVEYARVTYGEPGVVSESILGRNPRFV